MLLSQRIRLVLFVVVVLSVAGLVEGPVLADSSSGRLTVTAESPGDGGATFLGGAWQAWQELLAWMGAGESGCTAGADDDDDGSGSGSSGTGTGSGGGGGGAPNPDPDPGGGGDAGPDIDPNGMSGGGGSGEGG